MYSEDINRAMLSNYYHQMYLSRKVEDHQEYNDLPPNYSIPPYHPELKQPLLLHNEQQNNYLLQIYQGLYVQNLMLNNQLKETLQEKNDLQSEYLSLIQVFDQLDDFTPY